MDLLAYVKMPHVNLQVAYALSFLQERFVKLMQVNLTLNLFLNNLFISSSSATQGILYYFLLPKNLSLLTYTLIVSSGKHGEISIE